MLLPKLVNKTSLHEFTLAYNKLNKWLCIFGVLSEERAPSSVIVPEPGVLPWPGERGPSSPFSPDPEAPPNAYCGTAAKLRQKTPQIAWLRADGMLDTACSSAAAASWRKKRLLLKCAAAAAWGGEGGGVGRHCCGSGEILMELLRERALLRQWRNIGRTPAGADTAAAVGRYR